jgi:hypothetical protein
VFTVALGACSQPEGPTLPSVAGSGAASGVSAPSSSSVVAAYVEAQRAWAKCMRDAGFDTTDPDARGEVKFGGNTAELKADSKFMAAQVSCAKLRFPVPKELIRGPLLTAEQLVAWRAHAKCMRDNGLPSFPDPETDGEGYLRVPDDRAALTVPTAQELATQRRAEQICAPVRNGKPPTTPDPNATAQG